MLFGLDEGEWIMKFNSVHGYVFLMVLSMLLAVVPWDTGYGNPQNDIFTGPSRLNMVYQNEGGEFYDDLLDDTGIDRTACVEKVGQSYRIGDQSEKLLFFEDFESYSNGMSLFGVNGWMADTNRYLSSEKAQFTATTSGPSPMPSNTIGKVYNPDDEYSWVLSRSIDINSGILSCWIAADLIKENVGAVGIHLMNTQSSTPATDNRAAGIMLSGYGIRYKDANAEFHTLVDYQDTYEDTWYRFEIRFDCSNDMVSYYVFDEDGVLLGEASNVDFMKPSTSIGRIELFTMRDNYLDYFTSYWDDIKIIPPTGEGFLSGVEFKEDFQSYSAGQSLFGENGWLMDSARNQASDNQQFTATTTGPSNMPSSQVGKIYNPDDGYSFILSRNLMMTSGTITCWFSTDTTIEGYNSGGISLIKTASTSPSSSDRTSGLIVKGSDLRYRETSSSSSIVFAEGVITANVWYRFEIRFNCTDETVSYYVYDNNGDLIGAAIDTPMINPTDKIGRLEIFTDRDHNNAYTTCWWDDIMIRGLSSENSVVSNSITLPTGMKWTSMVSYFETYAGNSVMLDVLDDNEGNIQGFNYDGSSDQIDLSPLNGLDIESIRLKASLIGTTSDSPSFKGWGVEWSHRYSWRDSFLTSLQVGSFTDTEVDSGRLVLSSASTTGSMETEAISLPSANQWTVVKADIDLGTGSMVAVDVLDDETGNVVPGYSGLAGSGMVSWNISSIDMESFDRIRLRVNLQEGGTAPPSVRSLSVSWTPDRPPVIEGLTIVDHVFRTDLAILSMDISDPDNPDDSLFVEVLSRHSTEIEWSDTLLSTPVYNYTNSRWQCDFHPGSDAKTGNYSFRVMARDPVGRTIYEVFLNSTRVKNNIPQPPLISLQPELPRSYSEIVASIQSPGSDIETTNLIYDCYWYVNNIMIFDETDYGLRADQTSVLSPDNTKKGDVVKCSVRSFDGLDHSIFGSSSVTIQNSPPVISSDWPETIELDEDETDDSLNIMDYIEDLDDDDITWSVSGAEEIDVTIDESGQLLIAPAENYFGTENLTINVSDGDSFREMHLSVLVHPVNDGPIILSFDASGFSAKTGEDLEFIIEATDIDTDDLIYFWSKDGVKLSSQGNIIELNWTLEDWSEEEWMAKMNTKVFTVDVTIFDGEFYIGPFEVDVNVSLRESETYNQPPDVLDLRSTAYEIFEDEYVVITIDIDDPDDDDLTIFWRNSMVPSFNLSSVMSINVSNLPLGENVFTVTIMDGRHTINRTISIDVIERPTDSDGPGSLLIIGLIVAIIVILIISVFVAILISKRRKEKDKDEEREEDTSSGDSNDKVNEISSPAGLAPKTVPEGQLPPQQVNAPQLPGAAEQPVEQQSLPAAGQQVIQQVPPAQQQTVYRQPVQYQASQQPPMQQQVPMVQQAQPSQVQQPQIQPAPVMSYQAPPLNQQIPAVQQAPLPSQQISQQPAPLSTPPTQQPIQQVRSGNVPADQRD